MRADPDFVGLDKQFWATVRFVSQQAGYTSGGKQRGGKGQIHVPPIVEIVQVLRDAGLSTARVIAGGIPTAEGAQLHDYFAHRGEVLNEFVEGHLMDKEQAVLLFEEVRGRRESWNCKIPDNKQKGEKSGSAYLTGIVNMLFESHAGDDGVDYDPRQLTTVTREGAPLRTLSRRVDGCFPSSINPIGVWEIKEYYNTTTFGSRVADGVYETLLDGMEIEELRQSEQVDIKHLLIVDSHFTWWVCGRSYLCRLIDMLHMGYVDEILFGREVLDRLPDIIDEWARLLRARERSHAGPGAP